MTKYRPPLENDQFWTAQQAADYLKIHYLTLLSWIRKNKSKPPHARFGPNCIRIPIDKFKRWADNKTIGDK